MLTTCLALLIMSNSGYAVTVPAGTDLIVPGAANWVLGEPIIHVSQATRALVVRERPEGLDDVVEVKLYDGTYRLAWMGLSALTASQPVVERPAATVRSIAATSVSEPSRDTSKDVKSYGVEVARKRQPRRHHLPDFSGLDAAMAAMYTGMMRSRSAGSGGFGSSGGGYYTGPRQPAGTYIGGVGSSHKGGTYSNPFTGNHYQQGR